MRLAGQFEDKPCDGVKAKPQEMSLSGMRGTSRQKSFLKVEILCKGGVFRSAGCAVLQYQGFYEGGAVCP